MDATRAQEIVKTDQNINVKHEGVSVWIDSVDSANSTATVHSTNDPSKRKQVRLAELQEE